jgi:hypothetical protein
MKLVVYNVTQTEYVQYKVSLGSIKTYNNVCLIHYEYIVCKIVSIQENYISSMICWHIMLNITLNSGKKIGQFLEKVSQSTQCQVGYSVYKLKNIPDQGCSEFMVGLIV